MRPVNYFDLQYQRELTLYDKLSPVLKKLRDKYKSFADRTHQHERLFFRHLSQAIKIDKLPAVSALLRRVDERLNTDLKINLFLSQFPTSTALSIPRYSLADTDHTQELIILVSQHFLNELTEDEKLAILGHEVAHLLFGHIYIPAKAVLESEFEFADAIELKSDILQWLICSEVSCDIAGFLSCDCNTENFSAALLKYTTGLTSKNILADDQDQNVLKMIFDQVEQISDSLFDTILTTHPLTPLRLKIISAVAESNLVRNFAEPLPPQALTEYKNQFNAAIDEQIRKIYPEIIPVQGAKAEKLLFDLCVVVAMSDGKITDNEIAAIHKIISPSANEAQSYRQVKQKLAAGSVESVIEQITTETANQMKELNYLKTDVIKIVKQLLLIAASDTHISPAELDAIHSFAKQFGVTKHQILFLVEQTGVH